MGKKKPKKPEKDIICPYCGGKAVLKQGNFLFGKNAFVRYAWVCPNYPECDSYVSAHVGDKPPQGALADKNLRKKRVEAHNYFDATWRRRVMTRKDTYNWLKIILNLPSEEAHIAMLSLEDCGRLIYKARNILSCYQGKENLAGGAN